MKSKNNIPAIIVAHEHEGVRQVIVEICRAAGCVARGVSSGPVLAEYLDIMKTDIVILSDRLPFMTVEDLRDDYPEIKNNYKQIFSPETAFQMTSILEGVILRGTAKKLKELNLNIAGKTGTTNKNTDTWFIGFTSNLLVGVYVGSDNPIPLGKYETGSKTALPIFKSFISNSVNKYEARPFKAAKGTLMMVVDPLTGQKAKFNSKNTIIEVFKKQNVIDGKVLYTNSDRLDSNNILKFY